MNEEIKTRLRNYDNQDIDYTKRRYSLEGMVYYSKVRSIIFSKLIRKNINKEKINILDVGCGTCVLINQMSHYSKKINFTGLDFSKKMLKNCRLRFIFTLISFSFLSRFKCNSRRLFVNICKDENSFVLSDRESK